MNARVLIVAGVVAVAPLAARADECRVTASSIGDDFEAMVKAPFHMNHDAAVKTAVAATGIGASMIWLDAPVDNLVTSDAPVWKPVHTFASLTDWYGESGGHALIVSAGLVGAVALGGWLADEDRMLDTAAIMGESVVFTSAITYVGKMILGRKRPYNDEGPHRFEWFVSPGNDASVSFPSGHASTAFALAGAGAGRHPYWYVQVPAYALATSAALQRIDVRDHWLSDVLAGSLLGYAVSSFLVDRYHCDTEDAGNGGAAMSLSFTVLF